MMERHEHTNPWADKLQEVQLPDANDSWSAMEVLLDKEMPLGRRGDKRRWLLVILLLLLLIGVCNCPRQGQWNNWGHSGSSPVSPSAKDGQPPAGPLSGAPVPPMAASPVPGAPATPGATGSGLIPDTPASDSPVRLSETHISRGPNPGVVRSRTRSSGDRIGTSDSAYSGSSTAREPLRGNPASGRDNPASASNKFVGKKESVRHKPSPITSPGTPRGNDDPSGASSSATRGKSSPGPENSQQIKVRSRVSHTPAGPTAKKGVLKKNTRQDGTGGNIPGGKEEDEKKIDRTGGRSRNSHPGDPARTPAPGTTTPVTGGTTPAPGAITPVTAVTTTPASGTTTRTPGITTPAYTANKGKDSTAAGLPKNGGKNIAKKQPAPTEKKKLPENNNPAEKPDSVEPIQKGLVAGIGLNQFFSVGQQQKSDYNSGGTSGGLGDYLPIPMIRYYFSRKLFVQIEAQFNTPQYTKKDLVAGQSAGDTLSPGRVQQNSVVIKKLFYFNLPLSVHYSPIKNLYVGAGLQYSRLSNGVGVYENKVLVTGGTDSIKSAKVYSFKGDSIYQKMRTNEFRFLVDLSYTYKRFIIGARYNQALSKFLNVRLSDTQVTQARNSSLQLYIRYILWDGRKKKGSSSK